MVDVLTEFPLQPLVEAYDCRYFAENDTNDCETLNLALRSPFTKLYCLNRSVEKTAEHKLRFSQNDRVNIFLRTHQHSWEEVVRLIPYDAPAVFWLHPTENISRCLAVVARLRPAKRDILVVEPGNQKGVRSACDRYFGRTHVWHFMTEFAQALVPRVTGQE